MLLINLVRAFVYMLFFLAALWIDTQLDVPFLVGVALGTVAFALARTAADVAEELVIESFDRT